jgi:hypothetical protein
MEAAITINSKGVKTMGNGVPIIIDAITMMGRTNSAIWEPELAAIPMGKSSFPSWPS